MNFIRYPDCGSLAVELLKQAPDNKLLKVIDPVTMARAAASTRVTAVQITSIPTALRIAQAYLEWGLSKSIFVGDTIAHCIVDPSSVGASTNQPENGVYSSINQFQFSLHHTQQ
jgi:hypothetical protein